MRFVLWLAMAMVGSQAYGQTRPTIPMTGLSDQSTPVITRKDLTDTFELFADYSGLQAEIARAQSSEALLCNTVATGCTVLPTNAPSPVMLGALFGDTHVVPDWFKQTSDGADDAPSIRRAQATGMPLHFRCRHYTIASPSVFATRLQWLGCGAQLPFGFQLTGATGTWLDVDASFQSAPVAGGNAGAVPFTIQGTSTPGSVIESVGISQVQPYPASNATSWTPNTYGYVFALANTGGEISFRHTFWDGISYGIQAVNAGRLDISDMRGQFFNNAVAINEAHDVVHIVDFHGWPYWADNTAVEQYQQANLDTFILGRVDTPFISRFFSIGARSGIKFVNFGTGVTSGAVLSTISCDYAQYCLWVDNTALNVTFQADAIRSFAQQFAPASSPTTMLANSSVLQVEGQIYSAQIGSIVNFGTSTATISLANSRFPSALQIQAIVVQNAQFANPNTQMIALNSNGSNVVYLATPPLTFGATAAGYTYATAVSSGGLFSPSYAKLTGSPP